VEGDFMSMKEKNIIKHNSLLPLIISNSILGIGAGLLSPIILVLIYGLFSPSSNSEKIIGITILVALMAVCLILNILLKRKLYKEMKTLIYLMVIMGNLICSIGLGIFIIVVYFEI
jgi:hypothetical protein